MKHIFRVATLLLLCIFWALILFGLCHAATVNATSCSQAHVQAAVNSASRGDTVVVPAGSCTWSDQVYITKAITLQGAGNATSSSCNASVSTCITSNIRVAGVTYSRYEQSVCGGDCTGQVPMVHFWLSEADNNYTARLTGFHLNGLNSSGLWSPVVAIWGAPMNYTSSTAEFNFLSTRQKFRVDNNYIKGVRTLGADGWALVFYWYLYGVVDNNTIDGTSSPSKDNGLYVARDRIPGKANNVYPKTTTWADTSSIYLDWDNGTYDSVYFEDNTFIASVGLDSFGASTNAGSYVWRYNTFDYQTNSTLSYFVWLDTHGKQTTWTYAGLGAEIYGNKMLGTSSSNWDLGRFRGGKHKIFYNRAETIRQGTIQITATYNDTDMDGASSAGHPLQTCPTGSLFTGSRACNYATTPHQQTVNNSQFWNNRYGMAGTAGSLIQAMQLPVSGVTIAREAYEWFQDNSSCVAGGGCTSGVGCGSTLPATCTADKAYFWLTTQSCSSVPSGSFGRNPTTPISGALYKCSATNTWSSCYTPYQYPHPLRGSDVIAPVYTASSSYPYGQEACPPLTMEFGFSVTDASNIAYCKACKAAAGCTTSTAYADMDITMAMDGMNASSTVAVTCDTDQLYYARCQDPSGNESSVITIGWSEADNDDSAPPSLSSQSLGTAGRTLTLVFDEPVEVGAGGSAGWVLTDDAAPIALTYTGGSGTTTLTYQTASCIASGSTVTLDYTQPGNGIEDQSGNDFASIGDPVAVTNNSTQGCSAATTSLFNHSDTPSVSSATDTPSNLGIQFQSTSAGQITHVWFYKHADMDGQTHTGAVWSPTGTLLGSKVFAGETGSGWQSQALDTPVETLADTSYRVSVHASGPKYVRTTGYFSSAYTNSTFTVPITGAKYTDSATVQYPVTSSSTNFWVDFTFAPTGSTTWNVTVTNASSAGYKCSIDKTAEVVSDTATSTVVVEVGNGWKASISGCGGSSSLTGNTYTYTTGSVTENCTVTVTCAEKQIVPWIAE